jgi:hypothetical protein
MAFYRRARVIYGSSVPRSSPYCGCHTLGHPAPGRLPYQHHGGRQSGVQSRTSWRDGAGLSRSATYPDRGRTSESPSGSRAPPSPRRQEALPRRPGWRRRSPYRRRRHDDRSRRRVRWLQASSDRDLVAFGVHALHVRHVIAPLARSPWLLGCPRPAGGIIGLELIERLSLAGKNQHMWSGRAGHQQRSSRNGKDPRLH